MTALTADLVLTVFTIIGVGLLAFAVVMGIRYFFTEPDNYQSKRCRENLWKVPR